MENDLFLIWLSTMSIAVLHTIAGPDHYLPFIALAKVRKWSIGQTLGWTIICGLAHVFSSVVIALVGLAAGWSLSLLIDTSSVRGGIAGWSLLLLGLAYFIWGLWRAQQNRRHKHFEFTAQQEIYVFEHRHGESILPSEKHKVTPWVIFIIFLLGPCEPLLPILTYQGFQHTWHSLLLIVTSFTICTLAVMCAIVALGYYGISFLQSEKLETYMHALAGFSFLLCGAGMVFWGW